jgi:hypothetical protein
MTQFVEPDDALRDSLRMGARIVATWPVVSFLGWAISGHPGAKIFGRSGVVPI